MKVYERRSDLVTALFKGKHFKRMLYVGASSYRRPTDYKSLRRMTDTLDCLEVWPAYADELKTRKWYDSVECGDIAEWNDPQDYDLVVWWHGPEHMDLDRALETIQRLPTLVPEVWLATPWGKCPQGVHRGNPYQRHLSTWYPELYEQCDYAVGGSGKPNKRGSHLVAWYPPEKENGTRTN
jgi:hypothetical protein